MELHYTFFVTNCLFVFASQHEPELELEVITSHAAETCLLYSTLADWHNLLVLGNFSTGQHLQDTFLCPSASTQQVRSLTVFAGTGGICRK